MKKIGRVLAIVLVVCLVLVGCSSGKGKGNGETAKLSIAYQYGFAYIPLQIMQEQKLIEKHYGQPVAIDWQVIASGSAINEGIIAGSIDVAGMGIPPLVTGVANGVPYKMYSGLSVQPMGMHTFRSDLNSLADFAQDDKIALVSYGSIQHISLALACEAELGDPHALDDNILNMSNPDGMQALISETVAAHVTLAPYLNMEEDMEQMHEIEAVRKSFPAGYQVVVAVATEKLHDENPALYDAVVKATAEAIDYVNENLPEVAEMMYEQEGVDLETMQRYLNAEGLLYSTSTTGVLELSEFMGRTGMVENAPATLEEIAFENLLD